MRSAKCEICPSHFEFRISHFEFLLPVVIHSPRRERPSTSRRVAVLSSVASRVNPCPFFGQYQRR